MTNERQYSERKPLLTTELIRALGRSSEKLRVNKQYAPALAAADLALKLAKQLNDRPGQGLAWELIGRVYGAQRDYRRGLETMKRLWLCLKGWAISRKPQVCWAA